MLCLSAVTCERIGITRVCVCVRVCTILSHLWRTHNVQMSEGFFYFIATEA